MVCIAMQAHLGLQHICPLHPSNLRCFSILAETYVISVHGPAGEMGILQSAPDRAVDVDFRLVLEFLCDEFADCSGASARGFHYATRDRCMAGARPLNLGAAEARDTIEELEGKYRSSEVPHQTHL